MSLNKVYLDYLLFDCGLSIKNIANQTGYPSRVNLYLDEWENSY